MSKVTAYELMALLEQPRSSPEVQAMLKALGYEGPDGDVLLSFSTDKPDVELHFRDGKLLNFFVKQAPPAKRMDGLPFGLAMTDTREVMERKLGPPTPSRFSDTWSAYEHLGLSFDWAGKSPQSTIMHVAIFLAQSTLTHDLTAWLGSHTLDSPEIQGLLKRLGTPRHSPLKDGFLLAFKPQGLALEFTVEAGKSPLFARAHLYNQGIDGFSRYAHEVTPRFSLDWSLGHTAHKSNWSRGGGKTRWCWAKQSGLLLTFDTMAAEQTGAKLRTVTLFKP